VYHPVEVFFSALDFRIIVIWFMGTSNLADGGCEIKQKKLMHVLSIWLFGVMFNGK